MYAATIENDDRERITITLPYSNYELNNVARSLSINASTTESNCTLKEISDVRLSCLAGRRINIDELNFLTRRLEEMPEDSHLALGALIPLTGARDLAEIINLTYRADHSLLIRRGASSEAIGRRILQVYGRHQDSDRSEMCQPEQWGHAKWEDALDGMKVLETSQGTLYELITIPQHTFQHGGPFPPATQKDSSIMTIYVTHPDGGPVSVIPLPAPQAYFNTQLSRLGIRDPGQAVMVGAETDKDFLRRFLPNVERDSLIKLNVMCEHITARSAQGYTDDIMETALQYAGASGAKEVSVVIKNIDLFEFCEGVHDDYSLGKYIVERHHDCDEDLEEYIDYANFGADFALNHTGQYMDYGYTYYVGEHQIEQLMGRSQSQILNQQM